jgi:hypothetical protein
MLSQDSWRWARPPMVSQLLGIYLFSSVWGLAMGGLEIRHSPSDSGLKTQSCVEWGPGAHRKCLDRLSATNCNDDNTVPSRSACMHFKNAEFSGDDENHKGCCFRSINLRLRGGGAAKHKKLTGTNICDRSLWFIFCVCPSFDRHSGIQSWHVSIGIPVNGILLIGAVSGL